MISKLTFYTLFLISFLFCNINNHIFNLIDSDSDWIYWETKNDIDIYLLNDNEIPLIKIEKKIHFTLQDVYTVVSDISNYNNIITNRSVDTKLLTQKYDTLYAYQKIRNFLPATRNRHLIFKLYKNNNRIEWYLVSKDNELFFEFKERKNKELQIGVGAWEVINMGNYNKLIYYNYVDPELKLPKFILKRALKNSVYNIFVDIINAIDDKNKKMR